MAHAYTYTMLLAYIQHKTLFTHNGKVNLDFTTSKVLCVCLFFCVSFWLCRRSRRHRRRRRCSSLSCVRQELFVCCCHKRYTCAACTCTERKWRGIGGMGGGVFGEEGTGGGDILNRIRTRHRQL